MIPGLTPVVQNTNATTPQQQSLGKDDFLKLLVTQLTAQDPLSPMDAQDFSAQLAQFSSLEQMTNVNQNLELLLQMETGLSNAANINLIGKVVDAPGNTIDYSGSGNQLLSYSLAGDASAVNIEIFDSTGKAVNQLNLANHPAGSNQLIWDGRDSTGQPVPAGSYTFKVTANDSSGNLVSAETFTSGVVTDVLFKDGDTSIIVNGEKLAISKISRVSLNS